MEEDKTIFIETLGDYPALRIIDFLMGYEEFDYPITEIAKNSNVHFLTLKKLWPGFVKKGFVIKTRKLGRAELYKINAENEVIKRLMELDKFLCKEALEDIKKNSKAKHKKILTATIKH
jgi:predicted transcriptional regulator